MSGDMQAFFTGVRFFLSSIEMNPLLLTGITKISIYKTNKRLNGKVMYTISY
jgi:hypothetical protein